MNAVGKVINGKFEEYANNGGGGNQNLSELTGRVTKAEGDIDALETNVAQIDDAIAANTAAKAAKELSEDAANQITDLQMAMTEIYEGLEAQQSPDQEGTPVD